ncbi:uncharacterized protein LOC107789962 [Nicotiana tabacum]|uniref:Uncharacterized protein LOC107789962 n=2 Tax=Nicotiana TaxID=4085 RepID=A0A1S3ZSJ8_TOBAC|nr:PREDICTED: uncharacterized protein LOC104216560 [Nicotiana sylvestris]XP_016467324.1 PREDICTED: uncharacterized protein LOC107789962 [Nicotiana tabacum]
MDADERLTALKRAYADIILNTAKEAAARIMSSEQKAVRYKQELKVAKEEALGMLLRLKQMMDSKISEAELTSLSQQRKIEELEAQLQEAEDIVSDLRVDLREVQAELERVTSSKEKEVQNLGKDDTATPVDLPEENRVVLPPESQEEFVTISNTKFPNMKQNNQGNQSCSKMVQIGKPYVAGPDLPSIILRSKVPELYRNGCTQRIRACEGNLLDGDISVSKRENENGDGVDEGEGICSAPNHKVDDVVNPEEVFQQADDLLSSWHLLKSFRRKRRAVRNRKVDYSSPTSSSDHFLNVDKTSNTGVLRAHSSPAGDCASDEDPSQVGQSLSTEKAEPDMKLGLAEMDGIELQSAETFGVQNATVRNELVMAKIDPPRQGSRSLESLEVPVYRIDLENISSQLLNSESKTSDANDEVPSQAVNDRVIKYTFQRKRKRESLSVLEENAPIEKNSSKEINGKKQNDDLEPKMTSSATESSRDSRRVAQVARQLISLSEKKWWQ